jgi:hypothetical protein
MPEIKRTYEKVTTTGDYALDRFGVTKIHEETYVERYEFPEGGPFFDAETGDAVTPENALDALLAGATLATPFMEAHETLQVLREAAHQNVTEQVRHQRVLDAAIYVECRRREAAAWRMIGLNLEAHDFIPPTGDRAYFTDAELAELFGVNVEEIRKRAGYSLPAGLRSKEGALLFRVDAILTQLRNAGPSTKPSLPSAPKPVEPPRDPKPVEPKRREKAEK